MITLSPKSLFKTDTQFKTHADLVTDPAFKRTLMVALAEMELKLPTTGNPSVSWDCHNQMIGARTFIETLLNLCESPELIGTPPKKNLQYPTEPSTPKKP